MRIYIAGKITGDEDYRKKFNEAERCLTEMGYEVINPACLRLPVSCKWEDYMKLTLDMLDLSDAVYLLTDWKQSPGACIEYGYAKAKGKPIAEEGIGDGEDTGLEPEEIKSCKSLKMTSDCAFGRCPVCGTEFNSELVYEYEIRHCPFCGQKLDRGEQKG